MEGTVKAEIWLTCSLAITCSVVLSLNISSLIKVYFVLVRRIFFFFVSTNSTAFYFTDFNYFSVLLKCLGLTENEIKLGNSNHGKL